MGRGRVAENSRVRRSFGVASRISSSSSRKPRSSISSASSRMTAPSSPRRSWPRSRWSRRRPGVPTTMWQPWSSARRSARGVHAADAGGDAGAGIEPLQLALHLHGQLPRRGDHQGRGRAGGNQGAVGTQQGLGEDQAIGHGLARAGPGRDQQVAAQRLRLQHGELDGREGLIAAIGKRLGQRRVDGVGEHGAHVGQPGPGR